MDRPVTLIDKITDYLKTRDEAMGTPDQSDDERKKSADDIAAMFDTYHLRGALNDVKQAIMRADPAVLTDTLWMPEDICMGATVVDYIDISLMYSGIKNWRCFHCDEIFFDAKSACAHFGPSEICTPLCQTKPEEIREMERELERYRDEDSEKDRELYRMRADHGTALIREEEKGYARGLADGRAIIPDLSRAAYAIIESWDKRMGGDRERLATSTVDPTHQYWTPSGSMVDSEAIANLRKAVDGFVTIKPTAYLCVASDGGRFLVFAGDKYPTGWPSVTPLFALPDA